MEMRERNHAHANLHGSARQLAWLDSATCMVGLAKVHGWTRQSAWLDFATCMVQLPALHGWTEKQVLEVSLTINDTGEIDN